MNRQPMITSETALLTSRQAKEMGLSKYKFHQKMEKEGYERSSRGIYVKKDSWTDELFLLHLRCPQAVFSHDEAFYFHGLSDKEPLIHTLTIYSGYNVSRLKGEKAKFYFVKKELLCVGKVIVTDNDGNDIPMYNLERTVCDLIRSRNGIETSELSSILKTYVARKDKDLNLLMEYAMLFHIERILRNYMEVLL